MTELTVGKQYKAREGTRERLESICVALPDTGVVTCTSVDADGDMWTYDAAFLGSHGVQDVCVGGSNLWEEYVKE